MTNHHHDSAVRRAARVLALTPAVLLATAAVPAFASPPDQWGTEPTVPALDALLVYLIIPVGLALVITLLVYVPSLVRGQRYQPGLAWRNEPHWFGGPTSGVEAADEVDPAVVEAEGERGGASARW